MQTSAAGSLDRRLVRHTARAGGQRGFTLIELMVVVLIVALASGMVVFSLRDTQGIALEREGQRLAALLEYGRAQSRLQGTPVRWRATPQGFVLEGLNKPAPEQPWLSQDTCCRATLQLMQPAWQRWPWAQSRCWRRNRCCWARAKRRLTPCVSPPTVYGPLPSCPQSSQRPPPQDARHEPIALQG